MNNLAMLGTDVVQTLVIGGNHLVKAFLLSPDILALVLPVTAVTHDIKQILVHIDIVAAHNLARLVDDLLRQPSLAGNLDGKRTARITYRQLEQGLHALAVIEHRSVDHAVGFVGKMLQILVVGGYHTHYLMLIELLENRLGNGTAYLGLGSATHFIDQDEGLLAALRQEQLHVLQVAAIGTQVILDTLLVADVDKDVAEDTHVGIIP